jgi:hypothetical protein
VTIQTPGGACLARFGFAPRPGVQVRIGPVKCEQETAGASQLASEAPPPQALAAPIGRPPPRAGLDNWGIRLRSSAD